MNDNNAWDQVPGAGPIELPYWNSGMSDIPDAENRFAPLPGTEKP